MENSLAGSSPRRLHPPARSELEFNVGDAAAGLKVPDLVSRALPCLCPPAVVLAPPDPQARHETPEGAHPQCTDTGLRRRGRRRAPAFAPAAASYPPSPSSPQMPRQAERAASPPPSPALVARMAALLGAIPPAFAAAGSSPAAASPVPPTASAASPPPSCRRQRRCLSTATYAYWAQQLNGAGQQMRQLGADGGRRRSEPGPLPASPAAAPSPGSGGSASLGEQQPRRRTPLPQLQPQQGLVPLPHCAPQPHSGRMASSPPRAATPPTRSRRQSAAGCAEPSARHTPFRDPSVPSSPAAAAAPLDRAAAPPRASPRQAGGRRWSPAPAMQLSPAATELPAAATTLPPSPPSALGAGLLPLAAAAAPSPSSLNCRLRLDLLALLRRQRGYVGAQQQAHQGHLRRLRQRLGRLEAQWRRQTEQHQGQQQAEGRRRRSLLHAGRLRRAGALPPLQLECSEPTLGGEYLFEATLSPATARQAAPRPGTAAAAAAMAGGRVPSMRGGEWTPPPATPRLPQLFIEGGRSPRAPAPPGQGCSMSRVGPEPQRAATPLERLKRHSHMDLPSALTLRCASPLELRGCALVGGVAPVQAARPGGSSALRALKQRRRQSVQGQLPAADGSPRPTTAPG